MEFFVKLGVIKPLIIIGLFAVGNSETYSQKVQCDKNVKPIKGYFGYATRKNDLRCEGLYESPIGARFGIVSLLKGKLIYNFEKHPSLEAKDIGTGSSFFTECQE